MVWLPDGLLPHTGSATRIDRLHLSLVRPELDARKLLRRHAVRPSKRLGQNFLIDPAALRKIIAAAELTGDELVLEIGAGVGTLTRNLAQQAGAVVAVEMDRRLIPPLEEVVGGFATVQVIEGDVMQIELSGLVGQRSYCVVANIPYNITSTLIRKLVEATNRPYRIVLTLQREVAERAVAQAGKMSLLALSVQAYGRPSVVARIPARAFYPAPKVDSAVLRIDQHDAPPVDPGLLPTVFRLARTGFSQRRKMLKNSLAAGWSIDDHPPPEALLEQAGIDGRVRPQELRLEDWARLAEIYSKSGPA